MSEPGGGKITRQKQKEGRGALQVCLSVESFSPQTEKNPGGGQVTVGSLSVKKEHQPKNSQNVGEGHSNGGTVKREKRGVLGPSEKGVRAQTLGNADVLKAAVANERGGGGG